MNKGKIGFGLILLCFFLIFVSCEEETVVVPTLVTEDFLYISGERVRILARILTSQNLNATDHGFYLSEQEDFSQPTIISLGEREAPGRFIGEISDLKISKTYYVKSYLEIAGTIQYGNVLSLQTLTPKLGELNPNNGKSNIVVTITGQNFTSDTRVFFGDQQAEVLSIDFESRISVTVPPPTTSSLVTVRVISQGIEMQLATPFEYTTGKFTKLMDFPLNNRFFDNVYLQNGSDFYVGMGSLRGLELNSSMWKFSPNTGNWQQVDFPFAPLWMSFASSNYFGSGSPALGRAPFLLSNNFWKLENGQFIKLPDLPFSDVNAVAFEIGLNLYVMGGQNGLGNESYKYNTVSESWESISDAPFAINKSLMNFNHNGKQFFIHPETKEIFAFDALSETWSVVTNYPGFIANGGGMAIVVNDRAYVGIENLSNQVWELNLITYNWVIKNDFPGIISARNAGVFVHDNLIYLLRSGDLQISGPMEFWIFDPTGF